MRRLIVVAALLAAEPALAAVSWTSTGSHSVKGVGTTTEAAPTLSTEGMSLAPAAGNIGVEAFNVVLEADSGQTLSGGGNLLAYLYNAVSGAWTRMPELDIGVATIANVSGNRRVAFLGPSPGVGVPVLAQRGRIAFVPSGITVSSGGTTIYLNAWGSRGAN